ncbi:MAG: hypothetical protein MK082_02600 [Phycisphaerales bacterium]|nr:hypothetical protein [Phycisphaerales bacterium]
MNAEDTPSPEDKFLHEFTTDPEALQRVRRVGFLGPETVGAQATIDQLAEAFSSEGVEAESVSAVSVGERTFLIIDVGEGSVRKIVKFVAGLLAGELKEPVLGLIGNRAFTHRLNVALDAAGHGTGLLLPDEIVWVVPESLEDTMRELDEAFPSALKAHQEQTESEEGVDDSDLADGDESVES